MKDEAIKILRHIFNAHIDHAATEEVALAWADARDLLEYALADNLDELRSWDYLMTLDDCGLASIDPQKLLEEGYHCVNSAWVKPPEVIYGTWSAGGCDDDESRFPPEFDEMGSNGLRV